MKDEFEKALNGVFAGYADSALLRELKAGMLTVMEEQHQAMRGRGIIESAAIKKALSDLDRTAKNAELAAKGDKQKKLEHMAKAMGLSPLGQRLALLRLAAIMSAGFALLSAGVIWVTGGSAPGALGACTPFAAVAAGLFIYVRRKARILAAKL